MVSKNNMIRDGGRGARLFASLFCALFWSAASPAVSQSRVDLTGVWEQTFREGAPGRVNIRRLPEASDEKVAGYSIGDTDSCDTPRGRWVLMVRGTDVVMWCPRMGEIAQMFCNPALQCRGANAVSDSGFWAECFFLGQEPVGTFRYRRAPAAESVPAAPAH